MFDNGFYYKEFDYYFNSLRKYLDFMFVSESK